MNNSSKPCKIAVFDVDGTFLFNTTAEVQLVRFLRKRKMLPLINFIKPLIWLFRVFPLDFLDATLKNKMFLKGVHVDQLESVLPEFYETYLKSHFFNTVYQRMIELKKKGYKIIFISATLDFILNLMIRELGAHGGVAAITEKKRGVFTGRIKGIYPYYHGKVKALDYYLNGQKVDYLQSYAFADRWEDIPLLSRFGHPVAVNPTRRLRREALKRGWPIEEAD